MTRFAVLAAAICMLAAQVSNANADDAVHYRTDLLTLRLSPAGSAALRAASPVRTGSSPLAFVPGSGPLGVLAQGLGLTVEPEFPVAASRGRGIVARAIDSAVEERLSRHWMVHVPAGLTPERAIELMRGLPEVETVERVALVPVSSVPNDSLWSQSYYLHQASRRDVHALEAWNITRGDSAEIIAIIDTGVLLTHPDLAGPGPGIGGNIWTNAAEAHGVPGVDDDGNGYVDDVHGWDFVALPDTTYAVLGEDWQDEDDDPNDYVGHGTGVAGVAAAIANNTIGATGAAPLARIMPLRVGYSARLAPSGWVDESAAARAIVYAARMSATVINCSFSSVPQTDLDDALDVAAAAGVTIVAAAGNNGSPHAMGDRPEVISVAALDANDRVTMFSSNGSLGPFVDVAAAGLFLSTTAFDKLAGRDSLTLRVPTYTGTASGTSLAAPLVAAEVALIQADRRAHGLPPMDPGSVQSRIVETADDISAQNPGVTGYGSGRVNYLRALTDPVHDVVVPLDSPVVGGAAVATAVDGAGFAVVGTRGGHLVRVDGATHAVRWDVALPAGAGGSPAVADLGGGRGSGVFIGVTSGQVLGYDENGQPLAGWPASASCPAGDVASSAIADVDGDGLPDVVWGDANGRVWAWHADGGRLNGFPATMGGDTSRVWVALADLDGDGIREVVAAASDGALTVLMRDGLPAAGWPQWFGDGLQPFVQYPPMVALLEADPRPAIITTLDGFATGIVDVVNPDGSVRRSFDLGGHVAGAPAVADVQGDGPRDILEYRVTDDVYIARGNGSFGGTTNTTGVAQMGSLTPELIVGNGPAGSPVIDWTHRGALISVDGVTGQPLSPQRFGGGTPTLADLDGDHELELVVPDAHAPLLRIYPTGAPAAGNDRLWPTGRGNASRTGCSIEPGDSIADVIPPREVGDLRLVQRLGGQIVLSWTAPFEGRGGRAARYDIRRSPLVPDFGTFARGTPLANAPVPAAAGAVEHCSSSLPPGGSTQYYALVSLDAAGNASALSNVVSAPLALPPAVTDVHVTRVRDSALELAWTSTGDSGWLGEAASYELRASVQPIDSTSFDGATIRMDTQSSQPAGAEVRVALSGLATGRRYWIAVAVHDSLGAMSRLSNVVTGLTGGATIAPSAVTDLSVTGRGEGSVELAWTSTGDSGFLGQAAAYDIRASEQPIDSTNFGRAPVVGVFTASRPQGARETATLPGLLPGRDYWVALRATDSLGLVSPLSNVLQVTTLPPTRPIAVRDLRATHSTTTSIAVQWGSTGNDGLSGHAAAYDVRASATPFDAATFDLAEIRISIPATQPPGYAEHVVLAPLVPDQRYWIAVRARDVSGFTSEISNIVTAMSVALVTPAPVTDLRVVAVGGSDVALAWTSTGKSGKQGHAAAYELYASERPLDATNFDAAEVRKRVVSTEISGHVQSAELPGMTPGRRYWIAVQSRDSLDFSSELSNVVSALPGPLAGHAGAGIAVAPSPARAPMVLLWQADAASAHDAPRIRVVDIGGRVCRTLTASPGVGGTVRWDGTNSDGVRMPAGVYFALITTRTGTASSRFVLLR